MNIMRRITLAVFGLSAFLMATAPVAYGQLAKATNVYVLPMAGGLDQYLALWLTQEHVLQVVTDPARADVILTSRIGQNFKDALDELYKPKPKEDEDSDSSKAGNTINDGFARPNMQPLSRSRGTVFLVERTTGDVLWSDYQEPSTGDTKDIDKSAERLVDNLKTELEKARKQD